MKPLIMLALFVSWVLVGVALSACSDQVGADYYENDIHSGYPGPGTKSPGRDG